MGAWVFRLAALALCGGLNISFRSIEAMYRLNI